MPDGQPAVRHSAEWYPRADRGDSRSVMARASDGQPFKPYTWNGEREEPPAVIAARKRHRAVDAELERREESLPDIGPDPDWYRELAAEDGDELTEDGLR